MLTTLVVAVAAGLAAYAVLEPAKGWGREAGKGDRIAILVSRLEGDRDDAQTRHVVQSLEEQFGEIADGPAVDVLPYPESLTPGDGETLEALAGRSALAGNG